MFTDKDIQRAVDLINAGDEYLKLEDITDVAFKQAVQENIDKAGE